MTKDEDFKLLKLQTFVLRVNIHCDGCKQKVKKIVRRIEGVYSVSIDAEQQKVTVSGSVDPATLIKKLVKSGKHAELWSQKGNQNQNQKPKNNNNNNSNNNKGQQQQQQQQQKQNNVIKGLEAFGNLNKFPLEEDDDYIGDGEEGEEEHGLRVLKERANQFNLNLLRQQQQQQQQNCNEGNSAKKNAGNGNDCKKGNPNQNMGVKGNNSAGGFDQRTLHAMKMNNNNNHPQMGINNHGGGNFNLAAAAAAGGNFNGFGGVQVQPNNGLFPTTGMSTGPTPSMMMNMNGSAVGGYNNNHYPPSSTMMNMQNRMIGMHQHQHQHLQQQQPQMMYQRSPYVPPTTGYYYNYNTAPCSTAYMEPSYTSSEISAPHMFYDDSTTSSCSIM